MWLAYVPSGQSVRRCVSCLPPLLLRLLLRCCIVMLSDSLFGIVFAYYIFCLLASPVVQDEFGRSYMCLVSFFEFLCMMYVFVTVPLGAAFLVVNDLTEQSCYFINVFFISIFNYFFVLHFIVLEQPITLHYASVVCTVLVFFQFSVPCQPFRRLSSVHICRLRASWLACSVAMVWLLCFFGVWHSGGLISLLSSLHYLGIVFAASIRVQVFSCSSCTLTFYNSWRARVSWSWWAARGSWMCLCCLPLPSRACCGVGHLRVTSEALLPRGLRAGL